MLQHVVLWCTTFLWCFLVPDLQLMLIDDHSATMKRIVSNVSPAYACVSEWLKALECVASLGHECVKGIDVDISTHMHAIPDHVVLANI